MGSPVVHFDIIGPQAEALQAFYRDLFGWELNVLPDMGYALVDTMGGSGIRGGIGASRGDAGHVTFYVASDDLQATLNKAEALGGRITEPVVTLSGMVTLAMFADPEGHEVGVLGNPGEMPGGPPPGPSTGSGAPVGWFEVMGADGEALVSFYSELFGWTAKKSDIPGAEYWQMDTGGERDIKGGIGTGTDGQSYVTVYAVVPDVKATIEKATTLGATTILPPTVMPGGPEVAMFTDPQGHAFGVVAQP